MITLNLLVRRKPNVGAEEFRDFWMGEHASRMLALVRDLGIGRYTKCETQHEDEVNIALQAMYGTGSDSYDFVDQMVIGDLEDFRKGIGDADVGAALKELRDLSDAYIDQSRSDMWFSIDVPQIFPREKVEANWNNTLLKVYYVPRHLEALTLQEAQFHWNSCHGGMARQFASFLPYDKYIQGHRVPSGLIDGLKQSLGGDWENIGTIIGQAEAWINRRIMPAMAGPEVERMMRMLVVDIDLFVDASSSHIFATKEHVIHDSPIINEPVPSLFNAG